ncbi:MAG: helix-turn-helix transcriptional regulator, partial [Piscinibacter sp.]|nr:helix-turn-helix transcriptional regulator [Piscinibacter sp.]
AHRARYDALAPTRFVFDARSTPGVIVTMDRAMLALALPMAAPGVVRGVERHLAALAPRDDARASWAALVGQIVRHVEGAQLTLKGVAAQFGVSARTIDRRLAAEGVRFGVLCDEVRFERARELLRGRELGVAQVAERLGYRDAANFSRAFRRHAGMSPSEFQATGGTSGTPHREEIA